jgi:tricorn protease
MHTPRAANRLVNLPFRPQQWAILLLLGAFCATIVRAQSSAPLLLRDPSISKSQIAFAYAGSIWTANRDGSDLRRLTTGGRESKPAFSPDGAKIAFAGNYDGSRGVYVVSANGGVPRRLTYHPSDFEPVGWTPDGKRVLFVSSRAAFAGGVAQLFSVPVEGGFATTVPLVRASDASLSPDGTRIAYVPNIQWQAGWKRYRGGQTKPIWIAALSDSAVQATIPRDNSNDFSPMWVGETIYFLSDRNGPTTLFAYDVNSK